MHKILILTGLIIALFSAAAYSIVLNKINIGKEIDMGDKKVLIAYYSYSGNTENVAKKFK